MHMLSSGFYPEVIVSHTGWGCGVFAKYVFPDSRIISYCELWFNACNGEYRGIGERFSLEDKQSMSMYKRNITQSIEMAVCDTVVCATQWQRSLLPKLLAQNAKVIHEGTDCNFFIRNDKWKENEKNLITYATRGMEPMRGFPDFISGSIKFMRKHKNDFRVEIAGQDKVFYGQPRKVSYKEKAQEDIDSNNLTNDIIFRGRLNKRDYARLLKRSSIHCYFTREFVPSWSLIDAMSTGCLLVVNKTASIYDILPKDGVIWIDDISEDSVQRGLEIGMKMLKEEPERVEKMRNRCREKASKEFNRKKSIEEWFKLFKNKGSDLGNI